MHAVKIHPISNLVSSGNRCTERFESTRSRTAERVFSSNCSTCMQTKYTDRNIVNCVIQDCVPVMYMKLASYPGLPSDKSLGTRLIQDCVPVMYMCAQGHNSITVRAIRSMFAALVHVILQIRNLTLHFNFPDLCLVFVWTLTNVSQPQLKTPSHPQ